MNVLEVVHQVGIEDCLSVTGRRNRLELLLPEQREPLAGDEIVAVHPVGIRMRADEHRIERGVGRFEGRPPGTRQLHIERGVVFRSERQVTFALIPQEAADRKRCERLELAVVKHARFHPLADQAAARRSRNDTHRYAQFLRQVLREEITHRRDRRKRLAVGNLPAAAARPSAAEIHPDGRVGRFLEFQRSQVLALARRRHRAAAHRVGHVRLTGADPHFAHRNPGELQFVFLGSDNHLQLLSLGLERRQLQFPVALAVGLALGSGHTFAGGLVKERHLNRGGRIRLPPHREVASLLQNHVVGKNLRHDKCQQMNQQ